MDLEMLNAGGVKPTLQDDHAHRITLAECLHIGEIRGALDKHGERHFRLPHKSKTKQDLSPLHTCSSLYAPSAKASGHS